MRLINMKKVLLLCLFCLLQSQFVKAETLNVSLSPGDSYVAQIPNLNLHWALDSLSSVVFFSCGGLTSGCWAGSNSIKQTVDGITYEVVKGKLVYSLNGFSYWNDAQGNSSCANFPPYPGFGDHCSGGQLSLGYVRDPDLGGVTVSTDISIQEIKISTSKTIKPGIYEKQVYLNVSTVSGVWETKKQLTLRVYVKNNTCTMSTNNVVDMGIIQAGKTAKKKLDLNLNCSNPIYGSSWKYKNIGHNGANNTNLKNVIFKIKNNKNEVIDNDKYYFNPKDLNDLSVEVDAKNNAQSGKLNVPLQFSLIYS